MAKHRYVGNYANEVAVGDKRVPVAPGDFVENVDLDNEDNKLMIDEGLLVAESDLSGDKSAASNFDMLGKDENPEPTTDEVSSSTLAPSTSVASTSNDGGDK